MACHDTLEKVAQNLEELAKKETDLTKMLALKYLASEAWRGFEEHLCLTRTILKRKSEWTT